MTPAPVGWLEVDNPTHEQRERMHAENPEAYRWWALYRECARQMTSLYEWAEEHGIDLPSPGDSFT